MLATTGNAPIDVAAVAGPSGLAEWQDFVAGHAGAGPLHHAGWLPVIASSFAVKPHWLIARAPNGACVGVLPLYEARSLLFGSELTSLEGGILAASDQAVVALFEAAQRLRRDRRFGRLLLRGGALPATAPDVTRSHVHTLVDTSGPSEALWRGLPSNMRRKVNKAGREGIEVVDGLDSLPAFYDVYARTLRRLGTPVVPRRLFDRMTAYLSEHIRFFAVLDRDRFVGGMLAVDHGRARSSLYVAVDDEPMRRYANYLLYWTVIEDCCRSTSLRTLDLGRSVVDSGTHRFKRKWPTHDMWIDYAVYGSAPSERSRSRLAALAPLIWPRLPLSLCNFVGPKLRRSQPFLG